MKAIINNFDCSDADPIEQWVPDDVTDVEIWISFTIGPDSRGGDNFQVRVITEKSLDGVAPGEHTIVLSEYGFTSVMKAVDNILENSQGRNWDEISAKISKYMFWEFENYHPS